jgi:hypothetical protein
MARALVMRLLVSGPRQVRTRFSPGNDSQGR